MPARCEMSEMRASKKPSSSKTAFAASTRRSRERRPLRDRGPLAFSTVNGSSVELCGSFTWDRWRGAARRELSESTTFQHILLNGRPGNVEGDQARDRKALGQRVV